jgi:DNA-directed RNA polymerase specialized sigma24 family protein
MALCQRNTKKGTREMSQLQDEYEMSQADVAEKMFVHPNTVGNIEKRAIEMLKKAFRDRNIDPKDLLND